MSEDAGAIPSALALIVILSAQLVVVLDFSIVNVALPSLQRDLGFSPGGAQWVVTAYAITFGGLLMLGGRAGDVLGRRRLFLAGLTAFSIASLAGGFAINSARQIGSALGVAALMNVATSFTAHHRIHAAALAMGYREALVVAAGLAAAAFVVSMACIPSEHAHQAPGRLPRSRFAALQPRPGGGGGTPRPRTT